MLKKLIKPGQEFENKDEIILRDHLALERTRLANERTLLAYLRASVYLFLGGITFLQLDGFNNIKWIGYIALGFSAIFIVIGFLRFYQLRKRLKRYYIKAQNFQ